VLPALWRGEAVAEESLGLEGASLGDIGIDPPHLVVGGATDAILEMAARHADSWNISTQDPNEFAERAAALDAICSSISRARPLGRTAQVFVGGLSPGALTDAVTRFEEAGADSLVFVLAETRGADAVRDLARVVIRR
jgi:alkanesulfonate monooxygenase SsuD/methylene tetrahydromethanopterin reductase-like flavin-dependent oxidoreductase (luciferase family)